MTDRPLPAVGFRPVAETDFPLMNAWLAQPRVRGEAPTRCHLALDGAGRSFGYLQCYRNLDWPDWAAEIDVDGGLSIDLYIGETSRIGGGYGRAMLGAYVHDVAFPLHPDESRCYIAHAHANAAALACSRAVGFRDIADFVEDGVDMR